MTIRVAVDPTNPGQFFACCGLLELADRLWPGAEGWFTDGEFRVSCSGALNTLLSILVMDPPEEVLRLDDGSEVKPLLAPLQFSLDGGATTSLVLDAWMTIRIEKGHAAVVANPPWNSWLVALTAPQSAYLRQGCNLVPETDKPCEFKLVHADGRRESMDLSHPEALAFANAAAMAFKIGENQTVEFDTKLAERDVKGEATEAEKPAKGKKK